MWAENLKSLSDDELQHRTALKSWNILECLAHLNLYGNFYLLQLEKSIVAAKSEIAGDYKSGALGGYLAKSMLTGPKMRKMNTFQDKNPIHQKLEKKVIDKFILQQRRLLQILEKAKDLNLNKIKVQTTISSLLKLRLGDTLHFVVNHNLRHVEQAEKIRALFA